MPVFNERAQGSFKEMGGGGYWKNTYLYKIEKYYFLKTLKTWGVHSCPQEQKGTEGR